jgi:hypothetical protein
MYLEETDFRTIGEADLERRIESISQVRCLIPWGRCWDSRKKLFLKKCVKVTCVIRGTGESFYTFYYFEPKRWTLRMLAGKKINTI